MRRISRPGVLIILAAVVAGIVSFLMLRPAPPSQGWPLNDEMSIYTIHGTQNYDRGSTYYLYKEKDGTREVAVIDPASSIDLTHYTDRPVRVRGTVRAGNAGQTVVLLTYVEWVR